MSPAGKGGITGSELESQEGAKDTRTMGRLRSDKRYLNNDGEEGHE
jgi:hypothetical protein